MTANIQEEEIRPLLDRIMIEKELKEHIEQKLNKVGMYFHIFARVKEAGSLCQKLIRKDAEYKRKNKKLQDLIGIRIVLYYSDDIPICRNIIETLFQVRKDDCAVDKPNIDEFRPVKLNLICEIPDGDEKYIERIPRELWENYRIDQTFEVQIRTIFSEGWHEVEHDIRYKHKQEWENPDYYDFNRKLNGINATLEVCDNTIISVLNDLAYQCYKENKIAEMFRYRLRIHMQKEDIRQELRVLLENDRELLKKFYRLKRNKLLETLSDPAFASVPRSLNNIIYICNGTQKEIRDAQISESIPSRLKKSLELWQAEQHNA